MNTYFDSHFNKKIITIYPGEYYASSGPEMISTVLGSCISIALYDDENKIGGINHFMLAKDTSIDNAQGEVLMGKFGEYAIDLLIKDLVAKGAILENLSAKVFGGSNVFNQNENNGAQVGATNIKFAFDYLKQLKIPVTKSNTGGNLPRKIFFDPETSKVYMKYINNTNFEGDSLKQKEESYIQEIKIKEVKNLFPDD
ncbi:chemotaxis protein CheD [Treponema sp.]|uniref:chemotaxis protein CheD n=1 Tax=Treponema sp. TaxID=166 RepID=UPI00388DA25C